MRVDREDIEMLIILIIVGAVLGEGCLLLILAVAFILTTTLFSMFALIGSTVGLAIWLYVMMTTRKAIKKEMKQ